METSRTEPILGIDLGTTNSVVSLVRDGQVQVVEIDGQKILPSVVGLDANGDLLVGTAARNQWTLFPDRTVRSIKRKMGTDEKVPLGDESYTPQEISAMILRTLKERASERHGSELRRAVITVPAFFREQQREATREAGLLAGLEVVRIINEPTAAALAYDSRTGGLETVMVYDLGGGTFDVSIVQIEQGVVEVLASHGDTCLGGDDFDALLLDFVCDRFFKEHQFDLRKSLQSRSRVLRGVEEAKKQLSFDAFARVTEEFIAERDGRPLHLDVELARFDYEGLIAPLIDKTLICVDKAMADANVSARQIDRVLLVGGASRTPMVHRVLTERLAKPIHHEVDPDLAVAIGAAIQGGLIEGLAVGPILVDITPHTLGVRCLDWTGGRPSLHHFAPIIDRNTTLPASRSSVFQTVHDGQSVVGVEVFQGEHSDCRHNARIGTFRLEDLADVDAGNEILVRFDLNLDGILTVAAVEKATGKQQALTIDNVLSQFRDHDRRAAEARIDAAFGVPVSAVADADAGAAGTLEESAVSEHALAHLSPEARELVKKALSLIEKGRSIAATADATTAAEIVEIVELVESAVRRESFGDMDRESSRLDDLVFYLQDS